MLSIKYFFGIQEIVYKFQSLQDNFVHSIVKTFSKSIKELRKDLMVIYFVVLRKSCPDEIRHRTNVLPCEYPSIVYQL